MRQRQRGRGKRRRRHIKSDRQLEKERRTDRKSEKEGVRKIEK